MKKSIIYILIATVIWGSTFPIMKLALEYTNPIMFNFLRFFIAIIIFLPLFFKRLNAFNISDFISGFFLGFSAAMGYIFQIIGLKYTDPDSSTFITSLYIVIAPILAYFLLKEKIYLQNVLSLIIALIGLILISHAYEYGLNIGDILTVISAISYGFQIVLIDRYSKRMDLIVLSFYQLLFVDIFTFILIPFYGFNVEWNFSLFIIIIYISVFATALALFFQIIGQKDLDSTTASFIFVLEPVFGALFSFLMIKEGLDLSMLLGTILILTASFISVYQKNH